MNEQGPSEEGQDRPQLKKWVMVLYKILAAGKYRSLWLSELIILIEIKSNEDSGEKTDIWVFDQILRAIGPSINERAMRVLRLVYTVWRAVKLIWRN